MLIRPYIQDLTTSELHAVMVSGFGTIAGSVLGAYIGFGVSTRFYDDVSIGTVTILESIKITAQVAEW